MASSTTSSLLNFLSPLFPTNSSSTPPKFPPQNPFFSPNSSSTSNSNSTSSSLSLTTPKKQENAVMIMANKQQQQQQQQVVKEECPNEVMSVVCPSLAFANTLYFRSAYNVQVLVDDNENEERLLNRFRREVMRAGVIQECKRRRFFENKQDEKKRKSREAAKRNSRRRRTQFRGPFPNKEETGKVEKKEDDEDNWEMPDGDDAPF